MVDNLQTRSTESLALQHYVHRHCLLNNTRFLAYNYYTRKKYITADIITAYNILPALQYESDQSLSMQHSYQATTTTTCTQLIGNLATGCSACIIIIIISIADHKHTAPRAPQSKLGFLKRHRVLAQGNNLYQLVQNNHGMLISSQCN